MTQLLDYRACQGSNRDNNFPGTPLAITPVTPTYLGGLGLIVGKTGNIRVNLWSTVGLNNIDIHTAVVKFFIARNLDPISQFSLSKVIFEAIQEIRPLDHLISVTLNAIDFHPAPEPIPDQINYSLFAQEQTGVTIFRNGPENFSGMAVTD
jgi:hypothetical protein